MTGITPNKTFQVIKRLLDNPEVPDQVIGHANTLLGTREIIASACEGTGDSEEAPEFVVLAPSGQKFRHLAVGGWGPA